MRSYRDLFRTPEFTPLFLATAVQTVAQTASGLALGTLVYRSTGSPLLSAVSMFGPSLAQVLGATLLLSGADRLPPRGTLAGISLAFAALTALLALPGLPLGAVFAVVLVQGLVASLGGGVRWGLLNEILAKDEAKGGAKDEAKGGTNGGANGGTNGGYLLGRSVFNMMSGIMQITGYAMGGALVAALSPRVSLLLAAVLYTVAAAGVRLGLSRRAPRSTGRPSVTATWSTNAV
ncbi:MFS transporter, partial [Streptomyces sp. SID9944]|nr:MFS transporter [Streptomyces sp. SID9944]